MDKYALIAWGIAACFLPAMGAEPMNRTVNPKPASWKDMTPQQRADANWARWKNKLKRGDAVITAHEAMMWDDGEALQRLLAEHPEMINARDARGNTMVHIAARDGHVSALRGLLVLGGDPLAKNEAGQIPEQMSDREDVRGACHEALQRRLAELKLVEAVKAGDVQTAEETFRNGSLPASSVNAEHAQHTRTLLMEAVASGHLKMVQLLVQNGAGVNIAAANSQGVEPLYEAVCKRDAEMVHYLLKHGADVMVRTDRNVYPLHEAIWNNMVDVVRELAPCYKEQHFDLPMSGGNGYPAVMAAKRDAAESMQILIDNGLDVCDKRYGREPLLSVAARENKENVAAVLLKAGADPDAKDEKGMSARDYAQGRIAEMIKKTKPSR